LLSQYLKLPLEIIHLNLRNDNHEMIRDEAVLLRKIDFEYQDKKILLVDDVSRTGSTFKKAKEILNDAKYIKTLTFNGEADYSVYNEECFVFPWLIK
jgi:xanthine phosphoribosyltransferase